MTAKSSADLIADVATLFPNTPGQNISGIDASTICQDIYDSIGSKPSPDTVQGLIDDINVSPAKISPTQWRALLNALLDHTAGLTSPIGDDSTEETTIATLLANNTGGDISALDSRTALIAIINFSSTAIEITATDTGTARYQEFTYGTIAAYTKWSFVCAFRPDYAGDKTGYAATLHGSSTWSTGRLNCGYQLADSGATRRILLLNEPFGGGAKVAYNAHHATNTNQDWHVVLASQDCVAESFTFWLDGRDKSGSASTVDHITNYTHGASLNDHVVYDARNGGSHFDGCVLWVAYLPGVLLDFDQSAVRDKFHTGIGSANLVFKKIDTDTWDAFEGNQPAIFLSGGDPTINLGSLPNFTLRGGSGKAVCGDTVPQ